MLSWILKKMMMKREKEAKKKVVKEHDATESDIETSFCRKKQNVSRHYGTFF